VLDGQAVGVKEKSLLRLMTCDHGALGKTWKMPRVCLISEFGLSVILF
jgi:hypothetical protein